MSRRFATLATLSTLAWVLTATPAQAAQQYDCNQILDATAPNVALLSGLLGIIIPSGSGKVGLSCRPVGAGASGNLYCGGTSFAGLLVVGGRAGACAAAATTKAKAKRRARG